MAIIANDLAQYDFDYLQQKLSLSIEKNVYGQEFIICKLFDLFGNQIGNSIPFGNILELSDLPLRSFHADLGGSITYYVKVPVYDGSRSDSIWYRGQEIYVETPKTGKISSKYHKDTNYIAIISKTNYVCNTFKRSR